MLCHYMLNGALYCIWSIVWIARFRNFGGVMIMGGFVVGLVFVVL